MQHLEVKSHNELVNKIHEQKGYLELEEIRSVAEAFIKRNIEKNVTISTIVEEMLNELTRDKSAERFNFAITVLVALELGQNESILNERICGLLLSSASSVPTPMRTHAEILCCMKYPEKYKDIKGNKEILISAILESYSCYRKQRYDVCAELLNKLYPENFEVSAIGINHNSFYAYAMNLLACCYIKQKQYSRALLPLRKGLNCNDKIVHIMVFNLALSFYKSGQTGPAIEALELNMSSKDFISLPEEDVKTWPTLAELFGLRNLNEQNIQVISIYIAACMAAKENSLLKASENYKFLQNYLRSNQNLSINRYLFLPTLTQILSEQATCLTVPIEWKDIERNINCIHRMCLCRKKGQKNVKANVSLLKKIYFLTSTTLNHLKQQLCVENDVGKIQILLNKVLEELQALDIRTNTNIEIEKSLLKLQSITLCNLCLIGLLQQKSEDEILDKLRNSLQVFSHDISIRWNCVLVLIELKKYFDACKLWMKTRALSANSKITESPFKKNDTAIMSLYNSIMNQKRYYNKN